MQLPKAAVPRGSSPNLPAPSVFLQRGQKERRTGPLDAASPEHPWLIPRQLLMLTLGRFATELLQCALHKPRHLGNMSPCYGPGIFGRGREAARREFGAARAGKA